MSSPLSSLHRSAVIQALDLFAESGRQAFLGQHGFGPARVYFVRHPRTGELCDSSAIVGVACTLQFGKALTAEEFSGGDATVRKVLERLGFEVVVQNEGAAFESAEPRGRRDWSADEVRLLVADHLQMLTQYLNGQSFNKSAHRRALLSRLDGRSEAAIEFKHRNVSAVLQRLGYPTLAGYLPAENAQTLVLTEVVLDQMERFADLDRAAESFIDRPAIEVTNPDFMRVLADVPPRQARIEEPAAPYRVRTPIKRNYVERETHNRQLGLAGEKFVVAFERWRLAERDGLGQLADQVRHVALDDGDGLGYDVLSFERDGSPRYLEVKTTALGDTTPFFVTANELEFARSEPERFRLCRVFDFRHSPRFFELVGPVEQHVHLDPATWRASLQ